MATKKSAGYQIDFTTKTLTITKEFSDNAQAPASKEFGILMNLQNAIPGLTVIRKTHATPRKYVSKSTGETFNCNQFKNLTFDNGLLSFIFTKVATGIVVLLITCLLKLSYKSYCSPPLEETSMLHILSVSTPF